jgi:glycosidase
MFRSYFLMYLLLLALPVLLFSQEDSIYNDDPAQYLPIGMEVAQYVYRLPKGKKVDEVRVHPPNWWVGMVQPVVEVMIYDQDIQSCKVKLSEKKGVQLQKVHRVDNPNYLFLEIKIGPGTQPGFFNIILTNGTKQKKYPYEIKARKHDASRVQGLDASDLIYLIMPDRFANGDHTNDSFDDMLQSGINRDKMYFRHGGDLQGVIDHLDYLKELGITAIWLNPVLENDQPYASYHGYAITDFYSIDKRIGSNEEYKVFVEKCHEKGIKVVMDIIFNHCGHKHWFIEDIPSEDWINQWPQYTPSNFRSAVVADPYASERDKQYLYNGWFDYSMPDLNLKNQRLAKYMIQNKIWWTEFSGHDAYRIDTWYFPDQNFLSDWAERMQQEYPALGLFGETWAQKIAVQATFAENSGLTGSYNSNLPGITDFQMMYAIEEAMTKPHTWTEGVARIYYTLSQDFLYENPKRNVIFLDNHDKTRFFSTVGEDVDKLKSAITCLLTMRGIPSIYYGTELLFKGVKDPDGKVRQDFPGGWKEDEVNKFQASGRTAAEQDMFDYVKKLAIYRKDNSTLHSGKLMHFMPENGVYVYFRYDSLKTIMVIMNGNPEKVSLATDRFAERLAGFTRAKNVVTGKVFYELESINIPKNTTLVLELF